MSDTTMTAVPGRDHRIAFYDGEAFLQRSFVDDIAPALASGTTAVVVATAIRRTAIEQALAATGVDVEAARTRGDYLAVDSDEAASQLIVDGEVDRTRFHAFAGSIFEVAAARGRRIRICGDLAGLVLQAGDVANALELERLWNTLPGSPRFEMRCFHRMDVFDHANGTEGFLALCDLHDDVFPDEHFPSLAEPSAQRRAAALLQWQRRVSDLERNHLIRALETRDIIGQAKGILMERFQIDADAAFDLLREASNRSNRKVHDLAAHVAADTAAIP